MVEDSDGEADQLSMYSEVLSFLFSLVVALNAIALGILIGQSDCSHQQVICNTLCPLRPNGIH